MTDCSTQTTFSFPLSRRIDVSFDAGRLTQDAGLLLLRKLDGRCGLTKAFADTLHEWRDPRFVQHTLHDQVRERVFAIAQGYEDCNDAASLRDDPLFKACADRGADGDALASQPTLSRFEQRAAGFSELEAARGVLVQHFIERCRREGTQPRRLVLDLDSTDDPTHGQQEFATFNGYYDTYCYQQVHLFTGDGDLLFSKLLTGTANVRTWGLEGVKMVVAALRAAFPGVRILLRADNGFATPDLYDWCEDHCVDYIINGGTHAPWCERTSDLVRRAEELFAATDGVAPVQVFGEFEHQAQSWRQPRRVVAKAQRTPIGPDQRFVVTNLRDAAHAVYALYCGRGQMENWIRDLKLDVDADRLSCHRFTANELRMHLHALAYQLLHELRRIVPERLRHVRLDTLRLRLLRVAALVRLSARRLWVRISEHFPGRDDWLATARAIA